LAQNKLLAISFGIASKHTDNRRLYTSLPRLYSRAANRSAQPASRNHSRRADSIILAVKGRRIMNSDLRFTIYEYLFLNHNS